MVTYAEDGKRAYFNGRAYTRDDKTGYYLNSTVRERLHRAVYEAVHGAIPAGYDVHHIDGNKANNEPENLELMEAQAHKARHSAMLTDEQRDARRENMRLKAIPAAAKWHASREGRAWHEAHYARMGEKLHVTVSMCCEQCGKTFEGYEGRSRFCSNACKSAWRRASGIDDEARVCPVCGEEFHVNKYTDTLTCSRSCANRLRAREKRQAPAG